MVRIDLNVPTARREGHGRHPHPGGGTDHNQINSRGGKAIILAHFGRPKRASNLRDSLRQVVPAVSAVLGRPVAFAEDTIGDKAQAAIAAMKNGDVLLLENTRFDLREEKNDSAFADAMAKLGDIAVNDAFSTAHRAHASTEGISRRLPAYAGRAMEAELQALELALGSPQRPVVAIVGGAKDLDQDRCPRAPDRAG